MDKNENVIEFLNVRKRYGDGPVVLDGLSLAVGPGRISGLIGLNGAGKTTIIRIMAGLTRGDSGDTMLFGRRVTPGSDEIQSRIGYVLDQPMYFDWMGAEEYLRFVAGMYELPAPLADERIAEILDVFALAETRDMPIAAFSTGMKKKISLAAAIIHHPRLLVLDEPFDGLDAVVAHSIKGILAQMAAGGTTVFVTSHALETIEKLCDSVAVIHGGKIVMRCEMKDVREKAVEVLGSSRSLEELFVGLVRDAPPRNRLSWL
ncbi:MAG TPA: ABC transporter ATP-binding protein [Bacteroidota bacterium]|nr:ABC transporter ATP-binding protein [Bacteroidota bacterium]